MNLAGARRGAPLFGTPKDPALTIPQFLAGEETFYKITLPKAQHFDLLSTVSLAVYGRKTKWIVLGSLVREFRRSLEN